VFGPRTAFTDTSSSSVGSIDVVGSVLHAVSAAVTASTSDVAKKRLAGAVQVRIRGGAFMAPPLSD
jgi:hypothetical protein